MLLLPPCQRQHTSTGRRCFPAGYHCSILTRAEVLQNSDEEYRLDVCPVLWFMQHACGHTRTSLKLNGTSLVYCLEQFTFSLDLQQNAVVTMKGA